MEGVYRYQEEEVGLDLTQPPPPSEVGSEYSFPEASEEAAATARFRAKYGKRDKWQNPTIPKLDCTGKLGALWNEEFKSFRRRGKVSRVLIEGKDCLALVRRLRNSWKVTQNGSNSHVKATHSAAAYTALAELICFADMVGLEEEESFERFTVRPYRGDQASKRTRRKWQEAEAQDKARARTRLSECTQAFQAAIVAANSLKEIDRVERQVRQTLELVSAKRQQQNPRESGGSRPEFGSELVDYAAASIQSQYRGYALRKNLQQLEHVEISKHELALTKQGGGAFAKRDKTSIKVAARKRAIEKLLKRKKNKEEETKRFMHPAGSEAAKLATDKRFSALQQSMDNRFEIYIQDLWRALASVRSYFIESCSRYDLANIRAWLEGLKSYAQDDQVVVDCIRDGLSKLCPAVTQHQIDMICTFLDNKMTSYVSVTLAVEYIRGPFSDRRLFICSEAFSRLKGSNVDSNSDEPFESCVYDSRAERLHAFFLQYSPASADTGKAQNLDRKYKDDERTNKSLFKKLYEKHAPWITPPAILWKKDLQDKAKYEREKVNISMLITRYEEVLKENKALPRVGRTAVLRMLECLKACCKVEESKNSLLYAEFIGLHIELSAAVDSTRVFENIVRSMCGLSRHEWDEIVQTRIVLEDRPSHNLLRDAEKEKLIMLHKALGARSFETYEDNLAETLRKIRSSLLRVCGTDKSSLGLMQTFRKLPSFGNDRKVSRLDFKSALTKYGVVLTEADFDILSGHYDYKDTGFVSVDAFMFGVRESHLTSSEMAKRALESKSDLDEQKLLHAWSRQVRKTMVAEKKKEWRDFQCHKSGRTYWYCPLTGERRWDPPQSVLKGELRGATEVEVRRLGTAINELREFRDAAKEELNKQVEKTKGRCNFAFVSMNNNLAEIPPALGPIFRHVQAVWLDGNLFENIPGVLCSLPHLEVLSMNSTKLEALPKRIGGLSSLKMLDISGNRLKRLPQELSSLTSLEDINLSKNELVYLPALSLAGLHQLQFLDLSNNKLRSLPKKESSYKALSRLKWLSLQHNNLEEIPGGLFHHLGELTALDLSFNSIQDLPKQTGQLKKLTTVNMSSNSLNKLPLPLLSLRNLQVLLLQQNSIIELPEDLQGLSSLRKLSLTDNALQELPGSVGSLRALEELLLESNDLRTLPASFYQLKSLHSLKIGYNRLERLPAEMPPKVVELRLCNNKLGVLPPSFGNLQDLRRLDLANNELTTVPSSMKKLEALEYLRLDGCPLAPGLAKIRDLGHYISPDEENYLLLLRKLIDGLRGNDIRSRIDSVLGIPGRCSKDTQQKGLRLKVANKSQDGSLTLTPDIKSRNWAEQILLKSFQRFAEAEGTAAARNKLISEGGFRKCVQTVGILLSASEVDRLTARAFGVLKTPDTSSINYEEFVSAIVKTALGKRDRGRPQTGGILPYASKYYKVARAVVQYCVSRYLKSLSQGNDMMVLKNESNVHAKSLHRLVDKYKSLAAKRKELGKELKKTSKEAKIAEAIASQTERLGTFGRKNNKKKSSNISELISEPQARNEGEFAQNRRVVRQAIRQEQRKVEELEVQLRKSRIIAADYNAMLELQEGHNKEKERVRRQAQRRLDKKVLEQLFHDFSREVLINGAEEAAVSKGDMLAAVGDFYRLHCNGRNGLTPKEWRQKLLRTVNEAFTEGLEEEKTGSYVAFDENQDGLLDYAGFARFFKHIYEREKRSRKVEGIQKKKFGTVWESTRARAEGVEIDTDRQTHSQEDSTKLLTYVYVDLIGTTGPTKVELRDLSSTTVKQLKTKIEFKETVPKERIVLVFNGRRLEDHALLAENRIKRGSTIKALIVRS